MPYKPFYISSMRKLLMKIVAPTLYIVLMVTIFFFTAKMLLFIIRFFNISYEIAILTAIVALFSLIIMIYNSIVSNTSATYLLINEVKRGSQDTENKNNKMVEKILSKVGASEESIVSRINKTQTENSRSLTQTLSNRLSDEVRLINRRNI